MTVTHIVWDWNGTLLDDLEVVVAAVNRALEQRDAGPIDVDTYRDHYTRPVSRFYERLLGTEISDSEWMALDVAFHDAYAGMLDQAELTPDALEALELVSTNGQTQSLLSMFLHDELLPLVRRLGVEPHMSRIDGLRGLRGDSKRRYLATHIDALSLNGSDVAVIGDALDDVDAAVQVGASAVLYDSGSHRRDRLDAAGVPVAETLVEAVELTIVS